jgi:hypothetical protein
MRRVVGNGAQSRCSVSLPRFKTFPSYKPFSVTSGWQVFAVPTSRPLTGITHGKDSCWIVTRVCGFLRVARSAARFQQKDGPLNP